jgi:LPS export ABC transporter protein LptC
MKVKKLSIILLIVILLSVGTVIAVFMGYRQVSEAPEMLLSSIKDGANLSLGKIRQTATRDGKKEWSLEANSAHYIENDNKAVLQELSITYFLNDERRVYLNADHGILDTNTNDIEFSGNVVVKNEDYQLRTERLHYHHEQRLIFTDDPVQISGEAANLKGDTLRYDLNAGKVVLTGNVAAALNPGFEAVQGLRKP